MDPGCLWVCWTCSWYYWFLPWNQGFPADDVITAAAVGIVSGFAATGINQIFKQFKKNNPDLPVDDSVEIPEEHEDSSETN